MNYQSKEYEDNFKTKANVINIDKPDRFSFTAQQMLQMKPDVMWVGLINFRNNTNIIII